MLSIKKIGVKRKQPNIIIIGGGAAGVAAFQRLHEKGFNKVKIIEAEDRLGGRIRTVKLGENEVDLGAHWVHGEENNVVAELAKNLNLVEHSGDFNKLEFIFSDGSELHSDLGMLLFEQTANLLEDTIALSNAEGSVFKYLYERGKPTLIQSLNNEIKLEAFMNWVINFECSIEGCDDLEDASAKGLAHYKQCSGDLLLSWKKGGYQNIIDMLMKQYYKQNSPVEIKESIILNCEVSQLDWTGMGVLVKCKNGKVYYCDHAIITVSLGVLKEKGKKMFDPPLPDYKRKTIAGLGIGTVNKIYLLFPYQWWPKHCSGFSLLWLPRDMKLLKNTKEFTWERDIFGFYTEKRAVNTLTAWVIGKSAREMENYSEDQILTSCYKILKKFLASKYTIPEPLHAVRSSWYSNPHFRGSYSFRSLNSDALEATAEDLAKPLRNNFGKEVLLFAGEATHTTFYSSVHGAIESGWREADRIAESYKTDKLSSIRVPKSSL